MHQAVKTGFLRRRLPSEPNRLGHDIKLSRWAENLRPTKGAGPAGGGVPRFGFGSGGCRWKPDRLGPDIKLSWLAGAVLSMKGAHSVDKVPDKTLNCPCRW